MNKVQEHATPMNLLLARELSPQEEGASTGGECIMWSYYVTGAVATSSGNPMVPPTADPVIDAYCALYGTYT